MTHSPLPEVADVALLDLHSAVDDNGTLVVVELQRHLPFEIARVFAITAVRAGDKRGYHAHKTLHQVLVCLSGSVEVSLDDGCDRRSVVLDHPAQALHVPPGIWAEQTYAGPATALMVLCDQPYDELDYLRDYEAFVAWRVARRKAMTPGGGPLRLNLGCGGRPLPGYVNVDMDSLDQIRARYPGTNFADDLVVEQFDVFALPYGDDTVDEVRADGFVEHLPFAEEPRLFREAVRVLKPGGRLVVSVPDFEAVVRLWLAASDDWKDFYRADAEAIASQHWFGTYSYAMDNRWGYLAAAIFGSQNGEGQYHTNCYTEAKLRAICNRLGLAVESLERFRWKGDRDPMINLTAIKTGKATS